MLGKCKYQGCNSNCYTKYDNYCKAHLIFIESIPKNCTKNKRFWKKYRRSRKENKSKYRRFLDNKAQFLNPTKSEIIFEDKLAETGWKYKTQYSYSFDSIGGIADFYIPSKRLIIEIDGGYHNTREQKAKDKAKEFVAKKKLRIKTIRYTNKEAEEIGIDDLLEDIKAKKKQKRNYWKIDYNDYQHMNSIKQEISVVLNH